MRCLVCGSLSHWWRENQARKQLVQNKRDVIRNAHKLSKTELLKQLDEFDGQRNRIATPSKSLFQDWNK